MLGGKLSPVHFDKDKMCTQYYFVAEKSVIRDLRLIMEWHLGPRCHRPQQLPQSQQITQGARHQVKTTSPLNCMS